MLKKITRICTHLISVIFILTSVLDDQKNMKAVKELKRIFRYANLTADQTSHFM